ncbi:hypothetical protein HYDPIDRAFT_164007 [Hydnomerulius pinastri MD-312]|nr:hypothetical protein HYDPIDRAFT_164007 [Hydnomerulius pinastri MD-312]
MGGKRKLEDFFKAEDHARKKAVRSTSSEPEETNTIVKSSATETTVNQSKASVEVGKPQSESDPSDIGSLLDFSALTSAEDISLRFEAVAHELLCNSTLTVVRNGTRTDLDILELEFYLQKSGCHEDPFTHGSVEQECSGQWYFHRSPCRADTSKPGLPVTAAGGYRSGTRKGLDLTIGGPKVIKTATKSNPSSASDSPVSVRGGALLRTIRRRSDKKVICGPSLLVDEVLRLSGAPSINDLVDTAWNGDISALSPPTQDRATYMYLRRKETTESSSKPPTVFRSPRIGLDLSNSETKDSITHPRVVFVGKPYRCFTHPELLASKGRVQTFVGLYTMLRDSKGYTEDSLKLKKELCGIMGLKEQNVIKYMADYRSGCQVGKLKSFVGPSGKGVCQSASEYLKMMGTLQKVLQ